MRITQNKAPQTVEARGCADNPVQSGLSFVANDDGIINHFFEKSSRFFNTQDRLEVCP
jgi:hypothetical protein